jgi:putative transposase
MNYISHKIRIYPNAEARQYLAGCFGVSRFAYNWAIDECKRTHESGETCPSGYDLSKRLNSIKREQFPWMMDVTKWASQQAVLTCGQSFRRFFKKKSKYPRYKKKGYDDSLYLAGGHFGVREKDLRVSKLKSSIRMAEPIRFPGRILSVTISRKADQYFASFQIELSEAYQYPYCSESQTVVGVDLGIKDFAILSTGEKIPGPKALRSNERKLKRLQRSLSRKKKGSKNRQKARILVVKQYLRTRNLRNDFLHKLSTDLIRRFGVIVIEDLAVSNMVKNHRLAKSISDQGWREFRRQLDYKTKLANQELIIADRFYPSSKLCSVCGKKNEKLQLSDRKWTCSFCGTVHDRDLNAAINLKQLVVGYTERINACGVKPSGFTMIQEANLAYQRG